MSWTELPISQADVRTYLDISGTSGKFSDAVIGSNIRAAASFLEKETGRQFERQTATTKIFTTEGRAQIAIPDLRTATAVTQQEVALDANETFWLIPDRQQSGVYVAIQFRSFSQGGAGRSYLNNPQWFDRNLDRDWLRYGYSSLPNDLSITGNWGHDPYPHDFLHAVKILAAFYTRRPDSVLADVAITPEGNELRYSQYPPEVRNFIPDWSLSTQMVAI